MASKPHEPTNRTHIRTLDWATAATEARRQRDAEAKLKLTEQLRERRKKRAATATWSPQHDISRPRGV